MSHTKKEFTLIQGRYQVLTEIGRGGMGVVLLAFDHKRKRLVAIKILSISEASNIKPEQVSTCIERAKREIKILIDAKHKHIMPLYGYMVEGNKPYFITQYIQGVTLKQFVKDCKPSLIQKLEIIIKVAQALAHVHKHKIIHRDIKPENIMIVGATTEPMVIDFGFAKSEELDQNFGQLTDAGSVVGSLIYIPPEQIDINAKSRDIYKIDTYSLAAVLYEILAEQPMYPTKRGDTQIGVASKIIDEKAKPKALSKIDPSYAEGAKQFIADICYRGAAHNHEDRPTMDEFAKLLEQGVEQLENENTNKTENDNNNRYLKIIAVLFALSIILHIIRSL